MLASASRRLLSRAMVSTPTQRLMRPLLAASRTTHQMHPSLSIVSSFHTTTSLGKDDNGDNNKNDGIQVLSNNSSITLSPEEIDQILKEQMEELEREQSEKFVPNWKPGMRKRPLQFSYRLEDFEYELHGKERPWTLRDKRCGALAIKVGMMPLFDDWGVRHPCTVLFMDSNVVLGHKTMDQHGYSAMQLVAGQRKRKNVGRCVLGQYAEILADEENPPYMIREFLVSDESHFLPIGSQIHARHFCPGQNIDVSAIGKGKGFQGPMKRHGFAGLPASHGVSKAHRAHGSTGQCQDPGRVFKGKKMAGRMGGKRVTTQNLRIIKVDRGRNLLFVEGSVPGNKGNFVEIRDAVKKPLWRTPHVAGGLDRPPLPSFEFEEQIDGCGAAGHEEWMPLPDFDPLSPVEEAA